MELNPLELTEKQLITLWREDRLLIDDDTEVLEVIEMGEWVDEGKYSDTYVVFKDLRTGKHYQYWICRSGSYYSFYEYEILDKPVEVEKVIETIKVEKWVCV
jgi:hypothetical protein